MGIHLGMPSAAPAAVVAGLLDTNGRQATDMRLSLTDKCNLRCTYCMPAEGLNWLQKDQVLSRSEIVRLVRIGVDSLGIRELRLTGGEPLVRADLLDIIRDIRTNHPELPISMTTNALGLDRRAAQLKEAGLTRINVSMDSLHPETFAQLTRRPFLDRVLKGIEAAAEAGLGLVKINAVLMRGINDHEAPDLVEWAVARGFELRFIEQMPLDADHGWTKEGMVTAAEMRALVERRFVLTPDPRNRDGAPAERWEVRAQETPDVVLGTVGIIASVTEPFCADCRRTRVTAEGKVMSCLFSREETDLRDLLRAGADDDAIAQRWRDAMWLKPKAHGMGHTGLGADDFVQPDRSMSAIGG
ncbi:GTP 3',8-cyclase MoaA [Arthrobacter agilis]|uniref:GTP 3',8-cyclase MoaA n=1 Tax=Arthrobacter agilis TaxID=37921 RepID=UPI000B34EC2F|nr:GTP 3',8-cyclase MoaA [Arthrobacter agilis]OUM40359.1 GTP 3',8-cyclase MoaA [Arthrobacter agilis]PPB44973.1 GTP 3',8-cyclase MoaA [Arthrobacter agilis]TPV27676.1 GTP 3',8-cyclase MoaA [Arthrobacter agilis]VDR31688.1 Probable molybdopterin cofactor synthesis protein A [Arthrobacter agilis]